MKLTLRDLRESDLPDLYAFQTDPVACELAAFKPREHDAFYEHWGNILENDEVTKRAILDDGEFVGIVTRFPRGGLQELGYWIGREHWGRGIASEAVRQFLEIEPVRPLHAIVAEHNKGSLRILEKCGFEVVDPSYTSEEFPDPDVVDVLLKLD